MANVVVELIDSGIKELLHSSEIVSECEKQAIQIANAADGSFETETRTAGKNRSWVNITSSDASTQRKQLRSERNIYDIAMRNNV